MNPRQGMDLFIIGGPGSEVPSSRAWEDSLQDGAAGCMLCSGTVAHDSQKRQGGHRLARNGTPNAPGLLEVNCEHAPLHPPTHPPQPAAVLSSVCAGPGEPCAAREARASCLAAWPSACEAVSMAKPDASA
eukprot:1155013-Pelagomonas_calceolata.AAC.3